MDKIGILTFHQANNYGAVLQAFALQKVIEDLTKSPVEIIDYQQQFLPKAEPKFPTIKISMSYGKELAKYFWQFFLILLPSSRRKVSRFSHFRNEYINCSEVKYLSNKSIEGYSTYITGSDQVWNTSIIGNDTTYYLSCGLKKSVRIAYAASFGRSPLRITEEKYVKKYLPLMDYISVREDSAIEAINQVIDTEVSWVLDPTLLLDEEQWKRLIDIEIKSQNYVLLYYVEKNEELMVVAKQTAKEMNLPVIEITSPSLACIKSKADRKVLDAGPLEFLDLFMNAKFVVTNSFHGVAFSVNFNKDFFYVPHKTRGERITSLLSLLNLTDRIVKKGRQPPSTLKIDYRKVNLTVKKERNNSLGFLKKAVLDESNKKVCN